MRRACPTPAFWTACWAIALSAALPFALPATAFGAVFLASGTNAQTGTTLSATATFTVDASGNLIVTLANTGGNAVAPSDVLTAVFFTLNASLTPTSALLGESLILHGATPPDGNVGGEWAYEAGLAGAPQGASQGISAVGFGLFGQANFNGEALFTSPPGLQLGGLDAGIVSGSQSDIGSNQKILKTPLIQDRVLFILDSNLPAGSDLSGQVTNVSFQFGTDLALTNLRGALGPAPSEILLTPELPSALVWLLASGMLGIAALRNKVLGLFVGR